MIIVPYVPGWLHESTRAWAVDHGAELVELDLADDAYFNLLAERWHDPGDLIIVEQDVVPATDVVDQMLACRRNWCVSPYLITGGTLVTAGLGCVKFSARLKKRRPNLVTHVGQLDDDDVPAKSWRRLDVRVAQTLERNGYHPHAHLPSRHLHDEVARLHRLKRITAT